MIVAKHQRRRDAPGQREDREPGLDVGVAQGRRRRAAAQRRQIPVGEQQGFFEQAVVVVVGQGLGGQQPRVRLGMQVDQHIDRELVERPFIRALGERPGESAVAQILQQHQAVARVHGERPWRAQAEGQQQAFHPVEGAHVFIGRRRIHQHRPALAQAEPLVAAERRIAGQRAA